MDAARDILQSIPRTDSSETLIESKQLFVMVSISYIATAGESIVVLKRTVIGD